MRVKDFLGRARLLDEQIKSLAAERDHYRQLADNIGGGSIEERVSRSAKSEAPYDKWVERIADKDKAIDEALDRLLAAKMEISAFVDRIGNPEWQCLLRSRYVLCKPWTEVAEELGYGMSSVYRIHKKILVSLENENI
ncbi:MAG: RNA polymerase subunit sigma-70 [Schwartzia sp.]|nr:RNA polymerase subunit sigma-70 [Schwartzia sp. (in: firmicutes)]